MLWDGILAETGCSSTAPEVGLWLDLDRWNKVEEMEEVDERKAVS